MIDINDNCIYFLPYELERSNIEYFYNNFNFEIQNQKYTYRFLETISPKLLDLIRKGKVKIILSSITEYSHGEHTLKLLETAFKRANIDAKNVMYLMGNEVLNYNGDIIQGYSHATLHQQAEIGVRYPIQQSSLGYFCDYPKITDLDRTKIRSKKFLSWNRTMNRNNRLGLAYLSLKHDLLKDGWFSFLQGMPSYASQLLETLVDDDRHTVENYTNRIRSMIPYEIDTQHLSTEKKESFQSNENNKKVIYINS